MPKVPGEFSLIMKMDSELGNYLWELALKLAKLENRIEKLEKGVKECSATGKPR